MWSAFDQAEANARGHVPVVVAKRNHRDPLCVMRWEDALSLLAERPHETASTAHAAPSPIPPPPLSPLPLPLGASPFAEPETASSTASSTISLRADAAMLRAMADRLDEMA